MNCLNCYNKIFHKKKYKQYQTKKELFNQKVKWESELIKSCDLNMSNDSLKNDVKNEYNNYLKLRGLPRVGDIPLKVMVQHYTPEDIRYSTYLQQKLYRSLVIFKWKNLQDEEIYDIIEYLLKIYYDMLNWDIYNDMGEDVEYYVSIVDISQYVLDPLLKSGFKIHFRPNMEISKIKFLK